MSADLSTLQDQVADLATQLTKQNSIINASVQRVGVKTNGRGRSRERGSSNDSSIKRSYSAVASGLASTPSTGDGWQIPEESSVQWNAKTEKKCHIPGCKKPNMHITENCWKLKELLKDTSWKKK